MIFECSAIIVVILVMALTPIRSGKGSGFGLGILPLLLVPCAHIAGSFLSPWLGSLLPVTGVTVFIAMDLLALVATCLLLGGISTHIKKRRTRWVYLVVCGSFSAILTCVLLVRSVLA